MVEEEESRCQSLWSSSSSSPFYLIPPPTFLFGRWREAGLNGRGRLPFGTGGGPGNSTYYTMGGWKGNGCLKSEGEGGGREIRQTPRNLWALSIAGKNLRSVIITARLLFVSCRWIPFSWTVFAHKRREKEGKGGRGRPRKKVLLCFYYVHTNWTVNTLREGSHAFHSWAPTNSSLESRETKIEKSKSNGSWHINFTASFIADRSIWQ